jgi:hypothetical protein
MSMLAAPTWTLRLSKRRRRQLGGKGARSQLNCHPNVNTQPIAQGQHPSRAVGEKGRQLNAQVAEPKQRLRTRNVAVRWARRWPEVANVCLKRWGWMCRGAAGSPRPHSRFFRSIFSRRVVCLSGRGGAQMLPKLKATANSVHRCNDTLCWVNSEEQRLSVSASQRLVERGKLRNTIGMEMRPLQLNLVHNHCVD